jgi:hypothetical protein
MAEAVIKAALVAIPDACVKAVALRTPAEIEALERDDINPIRLGIPLVGRI